MEDPTLEVHELTLGTTTYKMCFDMEALADAEAALAASGVPDVNLLQALNLGTLNLRGLRALFAASLRKYQPTLSPKVAVALVTTKNVYTIWDALITTWRLSVGEPAVATTEGAESEAAKSNSPLEPESPAASAG